MAANVQKINVAVMFQTGMQKLADAYAIISKADQYYVKDGLSYVAGDFDNTALSFADPTQMGTIITELVAFKTWADSGNLDAAFKLLSGAT